MENDKNGMDQKQYKWSTMAGKWMTCNKNSGKNNVKFLHHVFQCNDCNTHISEYGGGMEKARRGKAF